jgi:hypothetical protein
MSRGAREGPPAREIQQNRFLTTLGACAHTPITRAPMRRGAWGRTCTPAGLRAATIFAAPRVAPEPPISNFIISIIEPAPALMLYPPLSNVSPCSHTHRTARERPRIHITGSLKAGTCRRRESQAGRKPRGITHLAYDGELHSVVRHAARLGKDNLFCQSAYSWAWSKPPQRWTPLTHRRVGQMNELGRLV